MTINVTSVNDAPSGTDNTVTTLEDTPYTFAAADFGFSDPNDSPANSLLAVEITTLPGAGTLTDNGVAVTAGQFVSAADINGGKLVFTPGGQRQRGRLRQLHVPGAGRRRHGQRRRGHRSDAAHHDDQRHAGQRRADRHQGDRPDGARGRRAQTVTGWATGISPGGGSDESSQVLNFIVTNNNNSLFSVQPAIDATTGTLTYTPASNGNGSATVTVMLQDNGGTANGGVDTSAAQTFTITVNTTSSVNHAPAGTDNTVTTLEDMAYTFAVSDFGFSDPNDSPANNFLAVEITTLPGAGTLKDNGVAVTAGQFVSAADITAASWCSARHPTSTAPATPASRSRCRTTAARPTAGWTPTRRRAP